MVSVQPVDASSFPRIYPLLRDLNDPYLAEADWQRLFTYTWDKDPPHCGYALLDDAEQVVGFIGVIFSQRHIKGQLEPFCNITSLVVQQAYRDYSLFLIRPVIRLKPYTITDLTPSDSVCQLLQQFDFQVLDTTLRMLVPMAIVSQPVQILQVPGAIATTLQDEALRLYQDHLPYPCHHLAIVEGNQHCYILYTKVTSAAVPYCHIQGISDVAVFGRYSDRIRWAIMQTHKTPFVLVDTRFVETLNLPWCYTLPFTWPRLYRSPHLHPPQIDNLYSENILLNLSNIPELSDLC